MGKVDIRVSLQPTKVFLHAPISLKVYKKHKLIDNVKMAGNLVIGVTTVPIIIKEEEIFLPPQFF